MTKTKSELRMTKEFQMATHRNTRERRGMLSAIGFVVRHSTFVFSRASRLLFVVAFAFVVSCSPSKRITKANVDEVEEGMSKKQVESILGHPTSITNEDLVIMKKTTYVYRQGKDSVTIVFKDDKVQTKESTLSN
jgi:SmpA/OmlA family protein